MILARPQEFRKAVSICPEGIEKPRIDTADPVGPLRPGALGSRGDDAPAAARPEPGAYMRGMVPVAVRLSVPPFLIKIPAPAQPLKWGP